MRHWSAQCPARCIWCESSLVSSPAHDSQRSRHETSCSSAPHVSSRATFEDSPLPSEPSMRSWSPMRSTGSTPPCVPPNRPRYSARAKVRVLHTHHVRGGTPGFAEASQRCYLRSGLAVDLTFTPPLPDELPVSYPELEKVPAFVRVRRERFHIPTRYMTDEYVGLLRTDSLVNTLNPESRAQFLDDIVLLSTTRSAGSLNAAICTTSSWPRDAGNARRRTRTHVLLAVPANLAGESAGSGGESLRQRIARAVSLTSDMGRSC